MLAVLRSIEGKLAWRQLALGPGLVKGMLQQVVFGKNLVDPGPQFG
jgi:hypothetical protein